MMTKKKFKNIPNTMVCLKIAELYPKELVPCVVFDEETYKYGGALVRYNGEELLETVYDLNDYSYESEKEVFRDIEIVLKYVKKTVTTMSN